MLVCKKVGCVSFSFIALSILAVWAVLPGVITRIPYLRVGLQKYNFTKSLDLCKKCGMINLPMAEVVQGEDPRIQYSERPI